MHDELCHEGQNRQREPFQLKALVPFGASEPQDDCQGSPDDRRDPTEDDQRRDGTLFNISEPRDPDRASFVAYGFAMYEFRGKTAWFIAVLVLMTVPFEIMMLPLFVLVNDVGLADSYSVIVLPFLAASVTIFFFRQYFLGIPKELLEAGRMDGVTEFGIFFKLVVPIAKPAFAAMAILNAMVIWNNFLWPLLVLRSADKFTLPIGLNTLLTPHANNYELLIIGSFFSLLPVLLLFFLFQRFFVAGMTAGALKG